ncbi:methyltransferase family protein [Aridibaculum aurantiacum]|uniref:methyltransferase family protein n=1 Tax=Aridibaculum aurantiacum TaxID=2810307 RepID=UPI001A973F47|nr:isoprenylcysteine carboxylmethyltransferase family protein [Aridibaculum aurantiacum]
MLQYLKYYLPLFLLVYLLITFVLPSIRVYKKTGINPVTFGKSDNAHDYIGTIMKVLTGLLVIAVLLFSLSANTYIYLNPIPFLQKDWLQYTGLFIIHASLIWIVIAQYHMKQSWRIGIDEKNRTELITNGFFSLSRNPIFLGMILSTIGIFLIIPDTVTFFVAATSYIVIQIQIRLEEEFLIKQHGTVYTEYKRTVRRLL